jgi:hypothetical protein
LKAGKRTIDLIRIGHKFIGIYKCLACGFGEPAANGKNNFKKKGDAMRKIAISLKDSELVEIFKSGSRKATVREIINREMVLNGLVAEIINQVQAMYVVGELIVEE